MGILIPQPTTRGVQGGLKEAERAVNALGGRQEARDAYRITKADMKRLINRHA